MAINTTTSTRPQVPRPAVTVGPMVGAADAQAFRELNEEWITSLFTLEQADRDLLEDPQVRIVSPGGRVLIARTDDGARVGCVAVVPAGDGRYELSKMAVSPASRGQGHGRTLILAAIDTARELGARTLFLGSSTKLPAAVHLYETVGFRHVDPADLGSLPYQRADVFMALNL